MLRTMMIALFASASVAMLAPDAASARGGFGGGGGGGFHGGGGFVVVVSAAAEWEWAAVASVQPQSAAVVSALQRSAAVSVLLRSVAPVSVRWHLHRAEFVAVVLPATTGEAVTGGAASTTDSDIGDSRLSRSALA
jgi:hypothetical protein